MPPQVRILPVAVSDVPLCPCRPALKLARAGSAPYRATTEDGQPLNSCYPVGIRLQFPGVIDLVHRATSRNSGMMVFLDTANSVCSLRISAQRFPIAAFIPVEGR